MRIDDRRIAGLGGIVFALFLVAGFTLFGPKGGHYSSVEVTRFMTQGAISFAMSVCLIGISTVGLIVLMAYFSETLFHGERRGRVMWASSLLAAGCFLIGWGLYLSPPSAIDSGGPAIDPGISYTFMSAGMGVLFGAGGLALGLALVVLATSADAMPIWVRALTWLAGASALGTWPFVTALRWSPNQWLPGPFYPVVLWCFVMGIWLLVSSRKASVASS